MGSHHKFLHSIDEVQPQQKKSTDKKTLIMDRFLKLKCYACSRELLEFVMLSCNHSLCEECLSARKNTSTDFVTVSCPCGLTTHAPSSEISSDKSSFTQTNTFYSPKRNLTQPGTVLGLSCLTLDQKDLKFERASSNSQLHKQADNVKYLTSELMNEMKFLQLKFSRYLNELNRNYIEAVEQYKKKFNSFCQEIKGKCYSLIIQEKTFNITALSNKISSGFKKSIEVKISKHTKAIGAFAKEIQAEHQNTPLKQNRRKQINKVHQSSKKSCRGVSHERSTGKCNIVFDTTKTKINFQELRQDIKEQKKLLKKTGLVRKPSQLFQNCQN